MAGGGQQIPGRRKVGGGSRGEDLLLPENHPNEANQTKNPQRAIPELANIKQNKEKHDFFPLSGKKKKKKHLTFPTHFKAHKAEGSFE